MLEFNQVDVEETPYLYEERTCSMDPGDISKTMGEAFHKVMMFMSENGIQTTGKVMAVYYAYDPQKMTFRAGFSVSPEDAAKAAGDIKADATPAGNALSFTHVGPYATLRDSYGKMMQHVEENGLALAAPTWEVYVNDPRTTPEEALRTDVFSALA